MATRFRGTVDHWDPALLEVLGSQRDVIVFDNRGTAASTGAPPDTIEGLAEGLLEFTGALGLTQVDLLGWSMGGYAAQVAAFQRPQLVRRYLTLKTPSSCHTWLRRRSRHRPRSGCSRSTTSTRCSPAGPRRVW
jgi:pimeloyl-ACP methyl ester carboxylesterase